MQAVVHEVVYGVVEQLMEQGYMDLDNYFVDGTKIKASVNRYQFVWRKSTEKNKAKLREKVNQLLEGMDEIEAAEKEKYGEVDLEEVWEGKEIDAEKLREAARKINERLKHKPSDKGLQKARKSWGAISFHGWRNTSGMKAGTTTFARPIQMRLL